MKKVLVLGSTGMLGTYVVKYLSQFQFCKVIPINRNDFDILQNESVDILFERHNIIENDVVVNCTGIIPQKVDSSDYTNYITVNTLFPLRISRVCNTLHVKFIHITTDCVFDGSSHAGNHDETCAHTAVDLYGVSKSLGERIDACIIRTSIIGEDSQSKSLLGWVKSQPHSARISGYTTHYWNGVTCLQLSKVIQTIIENNLYWTGVRHIFSPDSVSKWELIEKIISVYGLGVELIKIEKDYVNRTLSSIYNTYEEFSIPSITIQLKNMKMFDDRNNIRVGSYKQLNKCRFCGGALIQVFHLGNRFSLAGNFLRNLEQDKDAERTYPLSVSMCVTCTLIQCTQVVQADILFKRGYFYYSSMIPMLVSHFQSFANMLALKYKPSADNTVTIVEIGCNDGVLLRPLKQHGFDVIGVDPSCTVDQLIKDGFEIYNTYFDHDVCEKILSKHGMVDLFMSSNSFAHIDDMKNIMGCMKTIIKPGGCAIIEVHYLKAIVDELNFDFIYHEHMSYYSVTSIYYISKLYDMTLTKVDFTDIHGSSIRVYLKNEKEGTPSPQIVKLLQSEAYFNNIDTFKRYESTLHIWRKSFLKLYDKLISDGSRIYGYGSSGRANTFCSYCDLRLEYIIDDAKSKIGNYTPIYHSEIVSSDVLYVQNKPEYVIILAWSYASDIISKNQKYVKNGGHFIIPLPELRVI